ncbi:MAG: response regulator transcription factor [Desulfobacterales bacterium]
MEIESESGKGAAFTLYVPFEVTREMKEEPIRKIIPETHITKKPGETIRVLIADDHQIVRQGLATMLALQADIQVIGEAANGKEIVDMARNLKPDVILMDITMPEMDGIQATRTIKSENPHICIIGLSMHDAQEKADQMKAFGASAYFTKDGAADVLISAIRGVCSD